MSKNLMTLLQFVFIFRQILQELLGNLLVILKIYFLWFFRLFENSSSAEATGNLISSFPIHRIRFCARGKPLSPENDCFALSFTQQFSSSNTNTTSDNNSMSNYPLHQCHVFRCKDSETVCQLHIYVIFKIFFRRDVH